MVINCTFCKTLVSQYALIKTLAPPPPTVLKTKLDVEKTKLFQESVKRWQTYKHPKFVTNENLGQNNCIFVSQALPNQSPKRIHEEPSINYVTTKILETFSSRNHTVNPLRTDDEFPPVG